MNFLRGLFNNGKGKEKGDGSPHKADPKDGLFLFGEDQTSERLKSLWLQAHAATNPQPSPEQPSATTEDPEEVCRSFVRAVNSVYSVWHPQKTTTIQPAIPLFSPLAVSHHPSAMLEWFRERVQGVSSAVGERESRTVDGWEGELVEAVSVLARSRRNREVLGRDTVLAVVGIGRVVMRSIAEEGARSRTNTAVSGSGASDDEEGGEEAAANSPTSASASTSTSHSHSDAPAESSLPGRYLAVASRVVDFLSEFIDAERRWQARKERLEESLADPSASAGAGGGGGELSGDDSLENEVVALLVDLLRLHRAEAARRALLPEQYSLQALVLDAVGALLHLSPAAIVQKFRKAGLLELLDEMIGGAPSLPGFSLEHEFRQQMLCLHALREVIARHPASATKAMEIGIQGKVMDFAAWSCEVFTNPTTTSTVTPTRKPAQPSPTTLTSAGAGAGAGASADPAPPLVPVTEWPVYQVLTAAEAGREDHEPDEPLAPPRFSWSDFPNLHLGAVLHVVYGLCLSGPLEAFVKAALEVFVPERNQFYSSAQSLSLALGTRDSVASAASSAAAAAQFHFASSQLPLRVLELLTALVLHTPKAIDALHAANAWEVLFGSDVFYDVDAVPAGPDDLAALVARARCGSAVVLPDEFTVRPGGACLERVFLGTLGRSSGAAKARPWSQPPASRAALSHCVLALLRFVASAEGVDNLPEVIKIVSMIEDNRRSPSAALPFLSVLCDLLRVKRRRTQQALAQCAGPQVLVSLAIRHCMPAPPPPEEPAASTPASSPPGSPGGPLSPPPPPADFRAVRYLAMCAIDHFLYTRDADRSVRDMRDVKVLASVMDACVQLLALLLDPYGGPLVKAACLRFLAADARAAPKKGAAFLEQQQLLFSRVVEMIGLSASLPDTLALLDCVRDVLSATAVLSQKQRQLAGAGVFIQVMTALNADSGSGGIGLCAAVLRTLTALLAGNLENKDFFRREIGYQQLHDLILRSEAGSPSRGLFDLLFDMLVDSSFATTSSFRNKDAVVLILRLLPHGAGELQAHVLDTLAEAIATSTRNQSVCAEVGLLGQLLQMVSAGTLASYDVVQRAVRLVSLLGRHSISVTHLKACLGLLRVDQGSTRPRLTRDILAALRSMTERSGGTAFFDFDGTRGSGLRLSALPYWPESKGYTFCTWVRIEEFSGTAALPLYSFKTSDGLQGVEVFLGSTGVLVTVTHKGKQAAVSFAAALYPRKWYFICVSHAAKKALLGQATIRVVINGEPLRQHASGSDELMNTNRTLPPSSPSPAAAAATAAATGAPDTASSSSSSAPGGEPVVSHVRVAIPGMGSFASSAVAAAASSAASSAAQAVPLKYPTPGSGKGAVFDCNHIGTVAAQSSAPSPSLLGQLGAIYLFDDALSVPVARAIHALGPDYLFTFLPTDAGGPLSDPALADGAVSGRLVMALNAKVFEGDRFLDIASEAVPSSSSSSAVPRGFVSAHRLPGTRQCITRNLVEILTCLGSIRVILPLFAQCDAPFEDKGYAPDPGFLASVIGLLGDVLAGSPTNCDEMFRTKGFRVINHLLRSLCPWHFGPEVARAVFDLISGLAGHDSLILEAYRNLLYDFRVWHHAPEGVLEDVLATMLFNVRASRNARAYFRAHFGVQHVLDQVLYSLWMAGEGVAQQTVAPVPEEVHHPVTGAVVGKRPDPARLKQLRSSAFDLIAATVADDLTQEELTALLAAVLETRTADGLIEMLSVAFTFFVAQGPVAFEHLAAHGGPDFFAGYMSSPHERVRVLAVELIALVAERRINCSPKKRAALEVDDVVILMAPALSLFPLTESIFAALFHLLREDVRHGLKKQQQQQPAPTAAQSPSPSHNNNPQHHPHYRSPFLFKSHRTLGCMLQLLAPASWELRAKVLKELEFQVHSLVENQERLLSVIGWDQMLLGLLSASAEAPEAGELEKVEAHLIAILTDCCFYSLTRVKAGWEAVERVAAHAHSLAAEQQKGGPVPPFRPRSVLAPLYQNLIALIKKEGKGIPSPQLPQLTDNFVHFFHHLEEFLFHPWGGSSSSSSSGGGGGGGGGNDSSAFARSDSQTVIIATLGVSASREWVDIELALKMLELLAHFQLAKDSDFANLNYSPTSRARLRPGGFLRIALRLVAHALLQRSDLNAVSFYVHLLLNTKGGQRVGEAKVCYLLSWMWTALELSFAETQQQFDGAAGQAATLPVCTVPLAKLIRRVLVWYRPVLASILLDDNLKSLLATEHAFLRDEAPVTDLIAALLTPTWLRAVATNIHLPARDVAHEEAAFSDRIAVDRAAILREATAAEAAARRAALEVERRKLSDIASLRASLGAAETARRAKARADLDQAGRASARMWRAALQSVAGETGPWGSSASALSVYWKLDKNEDYSRQRRKLKRAYRDPASNAVTTTNNSSNNPKTPSKGGDSEDAIDRLKGLHLASSSGSGALVEEDAGAVEDLGVVSAGAASSALPMRGSALDDDNLLDDAKSLLVCGCELVGPKAITVGKLEVTTGALLFYAHYTTQDSVINDADDADGNPAPTSTTASTSNPATSSSPASSSSSLKDRKWPIGTIREVYMRRYLLRRTAIEICTVDRRHYLLNLTEPDCRKVYSKILSLRTPALVMYGKTPSEILKKSDATQRWLRREISNFDYLMALNTIAGRTYCDLSQYPVFPWVLSDYKSETLDLRDPRVYRDLSKPVGALNPTRLRLFQDRYSSFDDPETPRFHYGTHYSSAAITIFYLIRLEPFTALARQLQGGKMDHADRLFDSIPRTWDNVLLNTGDVKELIPEFFFLPEALENVNRVDLGTKQEGAVIDNALLPPWAKTPEDFIRIHREALESEYVSQNLHLWIDLIFGFRQRGPAAVEATNVFYYLTYEGAVDLDKITDPLTKRSIVAQINNFGQCPSQLFTKPHPHREMLEPQQQQQQQQGAGSGSGGSGDAEMVAAPQPFVARTFSVVSEGAAAAKPRVPSLVVDRPVTAFVDEAVAFVAALGGGGGGSGGGGGGSGGGVGGGVVAGGGGAMISAGLGIVTGPVGGVQLVTVGVERETCLHKLSTAGPQVTLTCDQALQVEWDRQQQNADTGRQGATIRMLPAPFDTSVVPGPGLFALTADSKHLLSAGHWDNSWKVSGVSDSRVLASLSSHRDVVTALALDASTVVTGSRDTTVAVWEAAPSFPSVQLRHVLSGHDHEVTAVAVSEELDLVVSGSRDGTLVIHSARAGRFAHRLRLEGGALTLIKVAPVTARFVAFSADEGVLRLFTINAKLLARVDTLDRLKCMALSRDGTALFTGGDGRTVLLRSTVDLSVLCRFPERPPKAITALALTPDETALICCGESGRCMVWMC